MKAVFVDRPDGQVAVREVAEPPLVSPYDCRVEMVYGTLCAGTDQHILHDRLPWRMEYPLVLGHESVGRVVAVGERVRNLKIGDLVARVGTGPDPSGAWTVGWGGFAQVGFARDWQAMRDDGIAGDQWRPFRIHQVIPPDLPAEAGPLFITLRETLSYSRRLGVTAGSRLLVVGSGGNALAFVAHARRLGAAQIVVAGAAAREGVFRAAGATGYRDYRDPDALSGLARASFDLLIDSVGKAGTADDCLPALASGATLGIYGLDEWDRIAVHPARAPGSFSFYNAGYDEAETHEEIVAGLREGIYEPEWWLGAGCPSVPLERIGDAFAAVADRTAIKPLVRLLED